MAAAGLLIVVYPIWSVASLTGEVLTEAPAIDGIEFDEDRHRVSALWKSDFELATRAYPPGVTVDEAIEALGDDFAIDSFGTGEWSGKGVRSKTCCGEYDAVLVKTGAGPDGRVTQSFSVFDSDVQFAFGLLAVIGLGLMFVGVSAVTASTTRRDDEAPRRAELVDA